MTNVTIGHIITGAFTATSTATATPVAASIMDMSQTEMGNASYVVKETGGVNGVNLQIDVSNDNVNWYAAYAGPVTVDAGATANVTAVPAIFRYVRLSIADANSGSHGSINATGYAQ